MATGSVLPLGWRVIIYNLSRFRIQTHSAAAGGPPPHSPSHCPLSSEGLWRLSSSCQVAWAERWRISGDLNPSPLCNEDAPGRRLEAVAFEAPRVAPPPSSPLLPFHSIRCPLFPGLHLKRLSALAFLLKVTPRLGKRGFCPAGGGSSPLASGKPPPPKLALSVPSLPPDTF